MTSVYELIAKHEGFRASVYQDHLGYWTIGYGLCVDARKNCGLTQAEARYLLHGRVDAIQAKLSESYPWYDKLLLGRKAVLTSMAYQLGLGGVARFKNMISAIERKDWNGAAEAMLDSKWAKQDTPGRAKELAEMMRQG